MPHRVTKSAWWRGGEWGKGLGKKYLTWFAAANNKTSDCNIIRILNISINISNPVSSVSGIKKRYAVGFNESVKFGPTIRHLEPNQLMVEANCIRMH